MKSLTIHNIENELYEAIRISAHKNRRSLNQEIKSKLSGVFLKKFDKEDLDYGRFLNLWDEKDFLEFETASNNFDNIDKSDWL